MHSRHELPPGDPSHRVRLDKWMWAARFYKTRALSSDEIDLGRVRVNGLRAKPGREVHVGDLVEWRSGPVERAVRVQALSDIRGPAKVACTLYKETPESVARRAALADRQRLAPEPALSLQQGRPTKRDRRSMQGLRDQAASSPSWNDRWSASVDDR
jgi:ribosome-associated heat shock protein Hsp15